MNSINSTNRQIFTKLYPVIPVTLPNPANWYLFRSVDISGTNLKNQASGTNDAVLTDSGACNTASKFSGLNRYSLNTTIGHIQENSHITFTNAGMTMCFWIKYVNNSSIYGNPAAMFGGNTGNALVPQFASSNGTAGYLNAIYVYTHGSSALDFNTGIPVDTFLAWDTWIHFAITYSGSTAKLYLNNTLISTKSFGTFVGWDAWTNTSSFIGGGANAINCSMDDFRLYNSALSAAQISLVYNFSGDP